MKQVFWGSMGIGLVVCAPVGFAEDLTKQPVALAPPDFQYFIKQQSPETLAIIAANAVEAAKNSVDPDLADRAFSSLLMLPEGLRQKTVDDLLESMMNDMASAKDSDVTSKILLARAAIRAGAKLTSNSKLFCNPEIIYGLRLLGLPSSLSDDPTASVASAAYTLEGQNAHEAARLIPNVSKEKELDLRRRYVTARVRLDSMLGAAPGAKAYYGIVSIFTKTKADQYLKDAQSASEDCAAAHVYCGGLTFRFGLDGKPTPDLTDDQIYAIKGFEGGFDERSPLPDAKPLADTPRAEAMRCAVSVSIAEAKLTDLQSFVPFNGMEGAYLSRKHIELFVIKSSN
jgi:hypothetical protein